MVEIEMMDEEPQQQEENAALSRSQERLSDADDIEAALKHITRPSAKLQVENLIARLRKEAKALERVAANASSDDAEGGKNGDSMQVEDKPKPEPPIPLRTPVTAPPVSTSKYRSFPTYYFDAGSYNSPTVSVYVPLDNIGTHEKSKITCHFTSSSFDLIVSDLDGKDYRLLNDNLEHDIDVSKSKYIIKPNKIIIKLGKIKGEYSYDSWTQLTAKKKKDKSKKDDPAAGIMDLMKDMYDSGDDNMKKMIGETMYKQRTGQLGKDGGMGDMGMGSMGMGDF
jgi:calcyclin binding protein